MEHCRLRPDIRLSRMKHCPEKSRFRTSLPHQRFSKPQRTPPRSTRASGSTIGVDSAVWQHLSCTHSRNGCSAAPEPQTGLTSVSAAHWHSKRGRSKNRQGLTNPQPDRQNLPIAAVVCGCTPCCFRNCGLQIRKNLTSVPSRQLHTHSKLVITGRSPVSGSRTQTPRSVASVFAAPPETSEPPQARQFRVSRSDQFY